MTLLVLLFIILGVWGVLALQLARYRKRPACGNHATPSKQTNAGISRPIQYLHYCQ